MTAAEPSATIAPHVAALVHGACDKRFEPLRDLMAAKLAEGVEVGASLYVSVDGAEAVDLWGGWRERERIHPWTAETIVNVFSGGKTVASLAMLMLVERGLLELDAPVAKYWPEFAANGKSAVTVRHVVSHSAGLPAWEPPFGMEAAMDIAGATARLAAQAPWWEPGTRSCYHASTFGYLCAELVLRVTGKRLSRFIADEIAGPLKADFVLGLADADMARTAQVYPSDVVDEEEIRRIAAGQGEAKTSAPKPANDALAVERDIRERMSKGSFSGVQQDREALFNSERWRRAEFVGSSGHGNARGLGRIMTAIANRGVSQGKSLLSPATIDEIFREQFNGVDAFHLKPIRWGTGYAIADRESNARGPLPFIRPGGRSCFWYGAGGSLALADLDRRLAFAYVMNQCRTGRRSLNGVYYKAVYECLGS